MAFEAFLFLLLQVEGMVQLLNTGVSGPIYSL